MTHVSALILWTQLVQVKHVIRIDGLILDVHSSSRPRPNVRFMSTDNSGSCEICFYETNRFFVKVASMYKFLIQVRQSHWTQIIARLWVPITTQLHLYFKVFILYSDEAEDDFLSCLTFQIILWLEISFGEKCLLFRKNLASCKTQIADLAFSFRWLDSSKP
ncbi:hypothetical protein Bealeia2_02058 (plasmid) [Candidatus Bealeia paramacronuclearis]|nr:hypothetical protein [Candidatus Bealeia paramacronuclearis]